MPKEWFTPLEWVAAGAVVDAEGVSEDEPEVLFVQVTFAGIVAFVDSVKSAHFGGENHLQ